MKEVSTAIEYKDKTYKMVFNLNVMEEIQDEYGSLREWGELTDGKSSDGEPNVKALIFGLRAMLNEGIEIENDENESDIKPLSKKQVGRMLTEVGIKKMNDDMNNLVIESTKSDEKNA